MTAERYEVLVTPLAGVVKVEAVLFADAPPGLPPMVSQWVTRGFTAREEATPPSSTSGRPTGGSAGGARPGSRRWSGLRRRSSAGPASGWR
jgi:hypothetical protein